LGVCSVWMNMRRLREQKRRQGVYRMGIFAGKSKRRSQLL
jgi:hypothetical protein